MPTVPKTKSFFYFLLCLATITLLLFSALNIENYLSPKKVLGTQADSEVSLNQERIFWEEFLTKNPNYLPGWIELERFDKVNEIDPNYLTP